MTDFMITINVKLEDKDKKVEFSSEETFEQVKKKIKEDLFTVDYENIALDNVTPKVYRNFGKVCIMHGVIPSIYDKRSLKDFFNKGQELTFKVVPKEDDIEEPVKLSKIKPKKIVNKENQFTLDLNDFPPLV